MERIIIPLSVIMGFIGFGLIAKWYVIPVLDTYPPRKALQALVLPHVFRYIGLWFLMAGAVSTELSPTFAIPAAYGDLLTAFLALLTVSALQNQWRMTQFFVWTFNLVGTLDLLNALLQGGLHIRPGQLGAAFYIPSLIVPFMLVSHFLIFRYILKHRQYQEKSASIA
jgi:urea transporter